MTASQPFPEAGVVPANVVPDASLVAHAWRHFLNDIALYGRVIEVPAAGTLLVPHGERAKVTLDVSPQDFTDHLLGLGFDASDIETMARTPQVVLDEVFEELGSRTGARLGLSAGCFTRY